MSLKMDILRSSFQSADIQKLSFQRSHLDGQRLLERMTQTPTSLPREALSHVPERLYSQASERVVKTFSARFDTSVELPLSIQTPLACVCYKAREAFTVTSLFGDLNSEGASYFQRPT